MLCTYDDEYILAASITKFVSLTLFQDSQITLVKINYKFCSFCYIKNYVYLFRSD